MASTDAVPTIDISGLFSSDLDERRVVARAIGQACEDIGFLTVTGHGVHPGLVREVFGQTRRVFARSAGEKMIYAWDEDHPNRGYDPPASQRLDADAAPDRKEAWSFSPEHVLSSPHPMQGPNRWPELAGFQTPVIRYHEAIIELAARLLGAMALSLDLPEDTFAAYHRNPICTLRLLHYPPRSGRATDSEFGAGAHSDWGALTILAQDDAGSLEVLDKRGTWIGVPPRDDAFVVNVGDLLALWTNDRYTSTMHRVRGVPDRDRYSVACFFDLDPDARIECLPSCTTQTRPPIYSPTTPGDHLLERYRASLGVPSAA
jgi:isopenicillin N synthase-like dioxygenase